jgi:hypothetical protein
MRSCKILSRPIRCKEKEANRRVDRNIYFFDDRKLKYHRIIPEATYKNSKRKIYRGEQGELL